MLIFIKMKEEITKKIEIPQGIEIEITGNRIIVKNGENKAEKKLDFKNIEVKKSSNELILEAKKATKRERKMINTISAHIQNMIKGLNEKFEYKLEVVYVHFPITLELNKGKNELLIKNFLGEKKPRICRIVQGAEVELNKNHITVTSYDKNIAGQTAANLEAATKIRNRDRRKFQDGVFIVEKCGRVI